MYLASCTILIISSIVHITEGSTSGISPDIIAAIVIVSVVSITIIVLAAVFILIWYQKHSKIYEFTVEKMAETYHAVNHPLFDRVEALNQAGSHEKEFSAEKITFTRELGEGAFGRVYQGVASNIIAGEDSTTVAVKQLKSSSSGNNGVAAVVDFFKGICV